jgi:hypothetical protein
MISCRFLVDIMMQQDGMAGDRLTDSLKLAGPGSYTQSRSNCLC